VIANQDGDGHAGFSFVKLGPSGTPLPDQSATYDVTPWPCIQDLVTGLVWEVHTDDGGLRDRDWRFSWYNSTGLLSGRTNGAANRGRCSDGANCDTEKYAAAVNAVGLCGASDWRLPTRAELLSLVDYGAAAAPLLDAAFLPNTVSDVYWSTTPTSTDAIWTVDFAAGGSRGETSAAGRPVRLVRGGH
jgi:hypothetical protein